MRNGSGWHQSGDTGSLVILFIEDPQELHLEVFPTDPQHITPADYDCIQAKIGLEFLERKSVEDTPRGRLMTFAGPKAKRYQQGVQVAFIKFLPPAKFQESNVSPFKLLRVDWRRQSETISARAPQRRGRAGSIENPTSEKGTAHFCSADYAKMSQSPAGFSTEQDSPISLRGPSQRWCPRKIVTVPRCFVRRSIASQPGVIYEGGSHRGRPRGNYRRLSVGEAGHRGQSVRSQRVARGVGENHRAVGPACGYRAVSLGFLAATGA